MKHKPIGDMSENEVDHFRDMVNSFLDKTEDIVVPTRQQAGVVAVWLKVSGRSMLNVHTEYSVDPEAFIEEAIQVAVWFTENSAKLARADGAEPFVVDAWKGLAKVLRMPATRPLVHEHFQVLFEHAGKRRVL